MSSLIVNITTPKLLRVVGIFCSAVLVIALVFFHASAEKLVGDDDVVLGKDFMAFYLAGRIILEGNGEELYDRHVQQDTQNRILAPEKLNGLAFFINPASVAVAYSLLAKLPYLPAFWVQTVLMVLCLVLGVWFLKKPLTTLAPYWGTIVLLSLSWFPMWHTLGGGQNAALSFMLLSVAFAALVAKRQCLAGLSLGILLFKPQYALPFLGLLLLRRQLITVAVAGSVGLVHYVLGGLFCGWDWPARMISTMGNYYRAQERLVGGPTHISIKEVLDYSIVQPLESDAAWAWAGSAVEAVSYCIIVLLVAYLIWRWRSACVTRSDFGLYWALTSSSMLLISLHAQYYEAALLILPLIMIVDYMNRSQMHISPAWRWIMVLCYVGFIPLYKMTDLLEWFRFQPVILLPIAASWAAFRMIGQSKPADAHEFSSG